MEQGTYNDKRRRKRPQPTEREIQDLIALISADERVTKISVVEPVSVLAIIRTSLGKVMNLPAAILRNKSIT
ncbi:hypothetical protein ABIC21_000348 [Pseudarthrobacter sp. PvP090]